MPKKQHSAPVISCGDLDKNTMLARALEHTGVGTVYCEIDRNQAIRKRGWIMNPNVSLDCNELAAFCRKWNIRELSLFGSALREDFGPESDLDFLVSFEPGVSLDIDGLLAMREELEARYERPVDLVEKEALRNPWRKYEILRTREVIYAV